MTSVAGTRGKPPTRREPPETLAYRLAHHEDSSASASCGEYHHYMAFFAVPPATITRYFLSDLSWLFCVYIVLSIRYNSCHGIGTYPAIVLVDVEELKEKARELARELVDVNRLSSTELAALQERADAEAMLFKAEVVGSKVRANEREAVRERAGARS